jgi:uncharacterized protein
MWIVALIIWLTLGGGSAAAFECGGVKLPSTLVICSDPELMRLADDNSAIKAPSFGNRHWS